jgi:hypothetical protein
MQSKKNGPAIEAYKAKKEEIYQLLTKIRIGLRKKDTASMSWVNWGHVGSMSRIIELLTEVDQAINGTPKYFKVQFRHAGYDWTDLDGETPDGIPFSKIPQSVAAEYIDGLNVMGAQEEDATEYRLVAIKESGKQ